MELPIPAASVAVTGGESGVVTLPPLQPGDVLKYLDVNLVCQPGFYDDSLELSVFLCTKKPATQTEAEQGARLFDAPIPPRIDMYAATTDDVNSVFAARLPMGGLQITRDRRYIAFVLEPSSTMVGYVAAEVERKYSPTGK